MDPISLFLGARALLARVPRWVWIAAAVAIALVAAVAVHGHVVQQALAAAHDRGVSEERARWQHQLDLAHAEAQRWRRQAETRAATISQTIGAQHAQETHRIVVAANDLRLRGPGAAAACPGPINHPGVPAPAGGPQPAVGPANDAGPGVPAPDRAAVPWGWLVDHAEQFDINRDEVVRWRDWYEQQRRLNESMRSAGGDR